MIAVPVSAAPLNNDWTPISLKPLAPSCHALSSATPMAEVSRKIESLDGIAGLSIRRGLIYEGELSPKIEKSDYFDYLVPFGQLLTA